MRTLLHLNGHVILIRGENVVEDKPTRFYVHINGEQLNRVWKSYSKARRYAGKLAPHWPFVHELIKSPKEAKGESKLAQD